MMEGSRGRIVASGGQSPKATWKSSILGEVLDGCERSVRFIWKLGFISVLMLTACDLRPGDDSSVEADPMRGIVDLGRWVDSPERWVVASDPEWVVGSEGAAVSLSQVQSIGVLRDGPIVIGDGATLELIVYDPRTGTVDRLGGEGLGPGEFQSIQAIFDEEQGRIGVYDPERRRKVTLDRRGTEIGSQAVPWIGSAAFLPTMVRSHSGGLFVTNLGGGPPGGEGSHRERNPVVRLDRARPDTITWVSGAEMFRRGTRFGPVMFGSSGVIAGASRGVWVGDTAKEEVELWMEPGAPSMTIRWSSQVDRALPIEYLREGGFVVSPVRPAFGALVVASTGELWIGSHVPNLPERYVYRLDPTSQEWLVVDPNGRMQGRVAQLPPGFSVSAVDHDVVVGIHRDALGVETVRAYRLNRR